MIYTPSEDSYLIEKEVRKFSKGKKVLEIGVGSGILMEAALESGAKEVLGVDIDKESVEYCNRKKLNVIESDLFSGIPRGRKFDLIIFNPPYLPKDEREDSASARATSGGKRGDEIILRFLRVVANYLSRDGVVLLLISSLTPLTLIKKIIDEKKMKFEILSTEKVFMERLEVWKIYLEE